MHDIDRTHELDETGDYEFDGFEAEAFESFEEEGEGYDEQEAEGPFDEMDEMDLAAQLLEVTDEAELDQFLGKLFKKAGQAAGRFMKSGVGQQLGGLVKGAIKKSLPMAGTFGNLIVPGLGGAVGGQLAARASSLLGLELEGLSPQDQEYQAARQLVRFAGTAAQNAASDMNGEVRPQAVARTAVVNAARRYAPGLIRGAGRRRGQGGSGYGNAGYGSPSGSAQHSGRWVRRGRKIILIGV